MKGILPLIFLYATLYLANGNFYRGLEDDQSYESLPLQFREDWKLFREVMLNQLQQDMDNGKKGPLTILGEALLETMVLLLKNIPASHSAEGQHRSDLSDLDFRDSSVIPRSGTAGENVDITPANLNNSAPIPGNTLLRVPLGKENESDNSEKICFVRQFMDLISLLVTNSHDGNGQVPNGPKILHLLVHELNENLESFKEVEILNVTLLRIFELIKQFLGGVVQDLKLSYKETREINAAVKLLSKIESQFDSYIEADREMGAMGTFSPALRLLLDQVENGLEELTGGKTLPNSNHGSSLAGLRSLLAELRSTLKLLILGHWEERTGFTPMTKILFSAKRVLERMIQEMKAFENQPESYNHLFLSFLKSVHSLLAGSLPE